MAAENTQVRGITAISVSGFKSLREESRIEVRPLTILAGANSSGKSSIMQPLLLMKQTLEAPYDPGPLLLNGPNVKFTALEQFLSKSTNRKYQDLLFGISIATNSFTVRLRKNILNGEIELVENTTHTEITNINIVIKPTMSSEEIERQIPPDIKLFISNLKSNPSWSSSLEWKPVRNRFFLTFALHRNQDDIQIFGTDIWNGQFETSILSLIHVPAFRGNPERVYPSTPVIGPKFFGTFEYYVAGIINQWQITYNQFLNELADILEKLRLTAKIVAKPINNAQVELQVGRSLDSDDSDMVSIADVGFGVSQVLPVLVALLVAEPGQLVYIEQPELHLHPRAQVALAQVLVDAANRGVRVVAETHSSLLLLGIQTLIAEGKITPDKVILHWFKRGEDGFTTIDSVEPDENGAYGNWPEDFSDVELNTQSRYLDSVALREMGK